VYKAPGGLDVKPSDLIGCDIYGCETSHLRVGKDAPNESE
jgi:hypothetical protein